MNTSIIEETLNGSTLIDSFISDDNNNSCSNVVENTVNSESIEKIDFQYKKSQNEQIIVREKLFNNFLEEYIKTFKEKSNQKKILKYVFFACIMFILVAMPIASFIVIANANNTTELIVTTLGSLAEFITSFIILPKIIAKYLFDTEEDKNLTNLIIKMQDYNLSSKDKDKKDKDNKGDF